MNGEYQLVPHLHLVPSSSCQATTADNSTSLKSSASYDGSLALHHAIPVCCNVPIGRMQLISAAVSACGSRNDCPFCSQITLAARFLSKEMMAFTSDSNEEETNSVKLIIQKGGMRKLIRINQNKVQEEEPIDVPNGSIISVFLPHDPARGGIHDQNPRKESRLSIQFTFISRKKECMRTREETRRPGCAPINKKPESEPQEQSQDDSQEGESPTLIMPHYLSFEAHGQNNSFESSISGGLLTLQESTSNLSSQKVSSNNAPGNCCCLLSSLSKEQLTKLLYACDDNSNAGKFRKSILEIALVDDPLPLLLRSTRINVNGDFLADSWR